MKKVLMTGLTGSLGPKVALQFKHRGWEVVEWNHHHISPTDLEQSEAFWNQVDVDAVCHMAMGSEEWAGWLAQRCAWKKIPYLFVSTAMVFDSEMNGPYGIFSQRNAKEDYGLYKIRSEDAIWRENPDAMIARIGWQIYDNDVGNNMKAHIERQHQEQGTIYASTAWYPATSHMDDTAIGFLQLIERNEPGLYHLDSNASDSWSFYELLCALKQHYDKAWQIVPCCDYQHDQRLHDERIALPPLSARFDRPGLVQQSGIVGTNWGRTHIPHYRDLGVDVAVLCANNKSQLEQVCRQEQILTAATDISTLNDLDVVSIATPAALHEQALSELAKPYIVCEKPLIGLEGNLQNWSKTNQRVLVNYAFSQLSTAKSIEHWLATQKQPCEITLDSWVNLPGDYSLKEWFLETASHPVAWLLHSLGDYQHCDVGEMNDSLKVTLKCGDHSLTINFMLGGEQGIEHKLEIKSDSVLVSKGYYRVGKKWRFDPILVDGVAVNQGEYSESDCWLDANKKSIALMLAMFNQSIDWQHGLKLGAFDTQKALLIERMFQ
ncbi:sugar nucleotide-binding protein [Vibrio sp. M260118]|uniref:sugar nucleotide-binding protein n=1 Tax=Vibrio sp. M260118 TaxID=3020896 RepID=UPI002F4045ED